MRILLAVAISEERFNSIPDIGLGYLAACVQQAGHDVAMVDCLLERYNYAEFEQYLNTHQPDVVGMKAYSCDIASVARMVRIVRRTCPGAVTVVGGPHPSCEIPERLFGQFPDLDYAFAGEGEPGFVPFLERLQAGSSDMADIPGLIWRDNNAIQANPKALVKELDALPFPAWDLLDPRRFKCGFSFMTSKLPAAPMVLTRGCPYQCTFCGSHLITGRKVRKRSIDNIIEEIRLLQQDYGIRTIDIVDENLAFDRNYLKAFCERLIQEDLGILWNCPSGVRLTSLDKETVPLMERSGCFGFSVGVESGSQRILDSVKKRLTVEEIVDKVRMIKRVSNITLQGFFMFGFPEETREDIEATIRLACSLPFDFVVFSPLRVTPGTEIYNDLVDAGKISSELDYKGFGRHHFVRSYSSIPDKEMEKLYKKAYMRFYFRPRVVLNLLSKVRLRAQLRTIVNGLLRMAGLLR
jgi:radical SAM superfamily enzyme YgiQ (UPF0313 family)